MKRLMAVAALCAAPMLAFATAASAAGDYPPDDSEVETETEQICASALDTDDTDPGGGDPDGGDPEGDTFAGATGNSGDPGEGDPGSDDDATGATGGTECSKDASTGTDEQVASGIATENPSSGSASAATVEGSLPETGSDASMIVRIAAMSVIAGGALIVVAWWRKRPSLA